VSLRFDVIEHERIDDFLIDAMPRWLASRTVGFICALVPSRSQHSVAASVR
jgi:hypothetical protein